MEKTHRITYRFDRNGNKIDENVEVERLEQLIRGIDGDHNILTEQNGAAVSSKQKIVAGQNEAAASSEQKAAASQAGRHEEEQELLLQQRYELDSEDEWQSLATAELKPPMHRGQAAELNEQYEHRQAREWWEQEESYKEPFKESYKETYNQQPAKRKKQEGEQEHAAQLGEETGNSEQSWVWQDASSAAEAAASVVTRKSTRQSFTWTQGAISVVSAIVSGGIIGYLLLTLVFGVAVWPMSALAQPEQQSANVEGTANDEVLTLPGNQAAGEQQVSSEAGQSQAGGAGSSLQLGEQAFQYYVLQAGVFTKENTRDEVISSLQQAGFAAQFTTDSSNRYFVYAGLATTTVDADSMQGKIKGIETYRKPLTIALPHAMAFNGEAAKLEQYFQQSNELVAMYADLVAVQLEQASYSKIGSAAVTSWQANYEQWLATAEATAELWSTQGDREKAGQLQEQLAEAQKQLEQYQKQPKSIYLWKVQSALVKSVLVQKDWFEQVNTLS